MDGYDTQRKASTCRLCASTRPDDSPTVGLLEKRRQADTLETIVSELRYQNAVLTEVISTLDAIRSERIRSATASNTAIDDHLTIRDERGVSR